MDKSIRIFHIYIAIMSLLSARRAIRKNDEELRRTALRLAEKHLRIAKREPIIIEYHMPKGAAADIERMLK